MQLVLNGDPIERPEPCFLEALLRELMLAPGSVNPAGSGDPASSRANCRPGALAGRWSGCSVSEPDFAAERVATVVNDEVVPRGQRAARALREGDRVEVLTFAGGG